jgi:hypothetical protein
MGNKFLLLNLKNLVINPAKAWETICSENKTVSQIRNSFLLPMIILVSLSAFLGSLLYTNTGLSPVYSVFTGIECFIVFYITIYASAYILRELSKALELRCDRTVSFRLVFYSIVPFLLCEMISRLFESLLFVDVLSIFGLYIFWIGAERILAPPENKKIPLLIGTFLGFIIIFIAADFLFTKLFDKIFYTFFS